jgi:hypothetical protein
MSCYSFGTSTIDMIFLSFIGLSGFIMGAAACRDIEIVKEARNNDRR